MPIKAPRGTRDILPPEIDRWHQIEAIIRELCHRYGFAEVRTPVFEYTELFSRSVGETTDIVQKEMYTFMDRGGRSITLRPEGTAAAARAFIEHKLYAEAQPTKLYYIAPIFRYERPQKGRFREHHQFGVELFGSEKPEADAEVIALAWEFYTELGIRDLTLHLNSIGCPECRSTYREALLAYLRENEDRLCKDCRGRMERNPLRVLDCKQEVCGQIGESAPVILDYLCAECREHFKVLKQRLTALGINYKIDTRLVRGLDYYTRTVFEFKSPALGAQDSIGAGGRYDGLVEEVGGPSTPGVGFGIGLERVILALAEAGLGAQTEARRGVLIVTAGDVEDQAFDLLYRLRKEGIVADGDLVGRSMRAQMKYADKQGYAFVVIVGEGELARDVVVVRDMQTGNQQEIPFGELAFRLADSL